MGKINVYDKIVMRKKRKKEKIWKSKKFIHKFHLKEDFGMECTAC